MSFAERTAKQSAVEHLVRNAGALNLTEDQVERLKVAFRLEAGSHAERTQARQIAHDIQAELKAALDQVLVNAEARGDKAAPFNDAGARRIKGRDGFGALHSSGSISEAEFCVGMAYRFLFEEQRAGLSSQLDDRAHGCGSNNSHGASAMGLFRAYATMRLTGAEAAVQHADPSGRALALLRAVVGEGCSLTSVIGKGGPRRRALLRLHAALGVIAGLPPNQALRIRVT